MVDRSDDKQIHELGNSMIKRHYDVRNISAMCRTRNSKNYWCIPVIGDYTEGSALKQPPTLVGINLVVVSA